MVLGLFLVAFFLKRVGGFGGPGGPSFGFILYFNLNISYLWYNVIGCAACVLFSLALQIMLGPTRQITTIAA